MNGCDVRDVFELVDQLPEVTRTDNGRWWRLGVESQTFGYVWEPTGTVGLKQTIAEQLALVAERQLDPRRLRCPQRISRHALDSRVSNATGSRSSRSASGTRPAQSRSVKPARHVTAGNAKAPSPQPPRVPQPGRRGAASARG